MSYLAKLEGTQAGRLRITIRAGIPEIRHRSAAVGLCSLGIVLEPPEAEVRQQTAAESLVNPVARL